MPGIPGALGAILGNPILEQVFLFNVAGTVISAAINPYVVALASESNSLAPNLPLSPSELALAVIRGELTEAEAAAEARMSGVNPGRFHTLTRITGDAPSPVDLAVALRRGIINEARFEQGIRQGRLRDEWLDVVKALSVQLPGWSAPLAAYLEGQLPEARARELFAEFGGAPEHFDWLFNSQGSAPTPVELGDLANRGIIPWDGSGPGVVSFEQGFLEGPWRNKWLEPMRKLARYVPPPRTVTAMYKEGAFTEAQAIELFKAAGLDNATAHAYLVAAQHTKVQATKELAQSTVLALYRDHVFTRDEAVAHIQDLGYSSTEAEFIVQVEDLQLAQKFLASAISKVHTLYVGHKISRSVTGSTLSQLGVPTENIDRLITLWGYEREANVKTLTATQIADAFVHGIIDQGAAQQMLEQDGYTAHDAWLFLSVHHKGPLPGEPGATAPAPEAG